VSVDPRQVVGIYVRVGRTEDLGVGAQRVAVAAERRGDLGFGVVQVADGAEQRRAVLVEQSACRDEIGCATDQVRTAALEDLSTRVANPTADINAWSRLPRCSLSVRAVVTACSSESKRSGAALEYTSARSARR